MGISESFGIVAQGSSVLRAVGAAWLIGLAAGVVTLALAYRTWRGTARANFRWLGVLTFLPPLLVVAATAVAVQNSRSLVLAGLSSGDPPQAELLFRGVRQEPAALQIGGVVSGATLLAWAGAFGLVLAARVQPNRRTVSPVIVVLGYLCLGLGPILASVFRASGLRIDSLAAVSVAQPHEKTAAFEQGLRQAESVLASGRIMGFVGVVVATILAAGILRTFRRSPDASTPKVTQSVVTCTFAMFVLAIAMRMAASPWAVESDLPWPANATRMGLGATTPQLEGADVLEAGVAIELTESALFVDRIPSKIEELGGRLDVYRRNYQLLHPGDPSPMRALVLCHPATHGTRLLPVLAAARQADFSDLTFGFDRSQTISRPVLGPISMHIVTGAKTSLTSGRPLPERATVLNPSPASTCQSLSEEIVAARQKARTVVLSLEAR